MIARTPQFLGLIERIYAAYRDLRDCRLIIREIERLVHLDDHLVRLADNHQPCTGHRFGGYLSNEVLLAEWTNAITRLLDDAGAPLPDSDGSRSTTEDASPGRGAPHRGSAPRRWAQGAAPPLGRRPAQRKRVGGKAAGMPVRRRASLARERDPLTGKFTRKAAKQSPPPE